MKQGVLLLLVVVCAFVSGCRNPQYNEVVKETYFHKYGVPVTKTDWETQGEDGKVVQLRKDGVTVSKGFSNGILNGETTFTFSNSSTVQYVQTYTYGTLVSTRENYGSGVPMREEFFENGDLAKLTTWYEDGTPAHSETYRNGYLLTGEYRTPLNVVESRVQDGEGVRVTRIRDGELVSKDTIENGVMVERVTYFANGDPQAVTPFYNGQIHGMRLTFSQGGLPHTVEQWMHGVQEGTTILYQNGEKFSELTFTHGKREGVEHRYRDGIDLVEEINWKEDRKHGPRHLYVDGETKTEWYHKGELVSRATYERMNMPQ